MDNPLATKRSSGIGPICVAADDRIRPDRACAASVRGDCFCPCAACARVIAMATFRSSGSGCARPAARDRLRPAGGVRSGPDDTLGPDDEQEDPSMVCSLPQSPMTARRQTPPLLACDRASSKCVIVRKQSALASATLASVEELQHEVRAPTPLLLLLPRAAHPVKPAGIGLVPPARTWDRLSASRSPDSS